MQAFPHKEACQSEKKIDNTFKDKPNVKSMFESHSCNNAIFKIMKTPIKKKARFTINECSNRSKKFHENIFNEARQKLC